MTHLRVENQNSNTEIVNAAIILKLYNSALGIEENLLEGESLSDYVSLKGNLLADHAKLSAYDYLTGNLPDSNNKRFPNLTINLTDGAYIDFADPEVERVLAAAIGDGIGVTTLLALLTTTLAQDIFKSNKTITTLNDLLNFTSLTSIGLMFANGCTNLQSIIIPASVITLSPGNYSNFGAFRGCISLSSVTLNEGLLTINNRAFMECTALTLITIPSTVTALGPESGAVFSRCTGLIHVYGGASVQSIGAESFYDCTELRDVGFSSNLTSIGASAFRNCTVMSSNMDLSNVTSIGTNAFRYAGLQGNLILDSLLTLGGGAFGGTLITSADLSNSTITEIPGEAFRSCSALLSVLLPSSCKTLGSCAFEGCYSFNASQLQYIETMRGNHSDFVFAYIRSDATQIQNASTLNLPNLKRIENGAFFRQRGINTVNFPSLEYMSASNVFNSCTNLQLVLSLGNIAEFNTASTYYYYAGVFNGCSSLTKVVLPNVRNLPNGIFCNCTSLNDLNLPSSITSIDSRAFLKTNSLLNKVMYFPNVTNISIDGTFANSAAMHIYLPGNLQYKREIEGAWLDSNTAWDYGIDSMFEILRSGEMLVLTSYTRVIYFKDITNFKAGMFIGANIGMVIINNTTIPTLTLTLNSNIISNYPSVNDTIFSGASNIGALYVPDSVLLNYINSTLFADLAAQNRILALSTCPRITLAQAEAGNNGIIEDYM